MLFLSFALSIPHSHLCLSLLYPVSRFHIAFRFRFGNFLSVFYYLLIFLSLSVSLKGYSFFFPFLFVLPARFYHLLATCNMQHAIQFAFRLNLVKLSPPLLSRNIASLNHSGDFDENRYIGRDNRFKIPS